MSGKKRSRHFRELPKGKRLSINLVDMFAAIGQEIRTASGAPPNFLLGLGVTFIYPLMYEDFVRTADIKRYYQWQEGAVMRVFRLLEREGYLMRCDAAGDPSHRYKLTHWGFQQLKKVEGAYYYLNSLNR